MKKLPILLALIPAFAFAQKPGASQQDFSDVKAFRNVQVGLSAGTTGVGLEVGTYLCKPLRMRVGIGYMPQITIARSYSMASVSDQPQTEDQNSRIERLCELLGNFMNSDNVDPYVDMDHKLAFWNAKVLFDVYPFHKKNWHFTVGAYLGPKKLGRAINLQSEAATMTAIKFYNSMYDEIASDPYYIPTFSFSDDLSFAMGPEEGMLAREKFLEYGRVVVPMGTYADGTPYYLEPDKDGVMYANVTSNIVKPYVGAGYEYSFGRHRLWTFGIDAGVLILGKVPHVHDNKGVCLTHDVQGIGGEVGRMVDMVKKFPVYPNLELRLSYAIY